MVVLGCLEFDPAHGYLASMHFLKTIMTALLLFSILPWCSIAAASAATGDIDGNAYFSDEAPVIQDADVTKANFSAPVKNKRIAVLQQPQCGANAPSLSGIDDLLFFPRKAQLAFEQQNFVPRYAQAPPTSPPRSV